MEENGTLLMFSVTQMGGQLYKDDKMVWLTLTDHGLTMKRDLETSMVNSGMA